MKKLLFATNLLFASALYFQHCTNSPEVIVKSPDGKAQNWHCLNYADSIFNGIPYSVASDMFNNYGSKQYNNITTNNAQPVLDDAKSVWFSLDILKKFIYKIEDTLHAKNFDPTTRLGIRFYFGAYPDSGVMAANPYLDQLPRSYANHHTLFMMPTFDATSASGTGTIHKDFNAFAPISTNSRPTALPLLSNRKIMSGFTNVVSCGLFITNDIYIQNHGEVGPPPQQVEGASFQ